MSPLYSNICQCYSQENPNWFCFIPRFGCSNLNCHLWIPIFLWQIPYLSNIPHDIPRIFPHSYHIPMTFPGYSHAIPTFQQLSIAVTGPNFFGATWSGRPARPCRRWPQGWRAWPKRDGAAPARIETRGRGPAKCETFLGSDRCWYSQKISLKNII